MSDYLNPTNWMHDSGMQLLDTVTPHKLRIYPSTTSQGHNPNVEWINIQYQLFEKIYSTGCASFLLGITDCPTLESIQQSTIQIPSDHVVKFLKGKFEREFNTYYSDYVKSAQDKPHIPYFDVEQYSIPQIIHWEIKIQYSRYESNGNSPL
jgi:hypothetical protein